MKKFIALTLALCFLLAACSSPPKQTENSEPEEQQTEEVNEAVNEDVEDAEEETPVTDPAEDKEKKLDLIAVTFEPDAMTSQAIVYIQNNSDQVFTGSVHVRFYDASGSMVGEDTIYPEEVGPGSSTYARINVETAEGITMEHSFGFRYEFTDAASASEATLDEDTTQLLADEMLGSFGGAGNPEWATSWYEAIEGYEVYSTADGESYAVVIVGDASQEDVDRIGNTVFGNYAKEYGLAQVFVKDNAGTTLFTRSQ